MWKHGHCREQEGIGCAHLLGNKWINLEVNLWFENWFSHIERIRLELLTVFASNGANTYVLQYWINYDLRKKGPHLRRASWTFVVYVFPWPHTVIIHSQIIYYLSAHHLWNTRLPKFMLSSGQLKQRLNLGAQCRPASGNSLTGVCMVLYLSTYMG